MYMALSKFTLMTLSGLLLIHGVVSHTLLDAFVAVLVLACGLGVTFRRFAPGIGTAIGLERLLGTSREVRVVKETAVFSRKSPTYFSV